MWTAVPKLRRTKIVMLLKYSNLLFQVLLPISKIRSLSKFLMVNSEHYNETELLYSFRFKFKTQNPASSVGNGVYKRSIGLPFD